MQPLSIGFIRKQINNENFLSTYPEDFKKAYFFFLLVMNVGGIVWGILCLVFKFYLVSIIPFGYFTLSLANLWYLFKSENFILTRFIQVLFSMLLPFLFQWLLGGFNATGVVMLWSVLTLIALLTFFKSNQGLGWMILFITLLISSAIADDFLTSFTPEVLKTTQVQRVLLTINVGMIGIITFFLSKFFINNDRRTKSLNTTLEEQKNDIMERNFEIEQQNEEILSINDDLNHQTNQVKRKNLAILGSINYAKNIQQALHASPAHLKKLLPQSFVLNQPKDIVSGDFFWFTQTETTPVYDEINTFNGVEQVLKDFENEKIIIAAVDCTGHGVPGAFMTVMGKVFLDEIVNQNGTTDPAKILCELDQKIVTSFSQSADSTRINDGMDMAIIVIDTEDQKITFAGAKNPLWYVRDNEIHQVKGSKFPIGSAQYKHNKSFDKTTLDIQAGDVYYIFSDGFQDQFGGVRDTKYMRKQFRELLLTVSKLTPVQQESALREEFNRWKGEKNQTDDVLIIGLKF